MRCEIRALAASKRSIEAIRRLKIPDDGRKVAEAGLDILVPFFGGSNALRSDGANLGMPDSSSNQFVCIAAIVLLHCNIVQKMNSEKAAGMTGGLGSELLSGADLLGRDLSRRIERAGIVDLGHLMVAKAQHLAQDFVGVFA